MRPGVCQFVLKAVRVTLLQASLQRIVIRKRIRTESVDGNIERWVAVARVRIVIRGIQIARSGSTRPVIVLRRTPRRGGKRISPQDRNLLIAVVKSEELQSARTSVRNFKNGVGGQLIFETEMPLLSVGRDQTRI